MDCIVNNSLNNAIIEISMNAFSSTVQYTFCITYIGVLSTDIEQNYINIIIIMNLSH